MKDIKMQSVSSSNLAAVGYDEDSNTLRVQFQNGAMYEYDRVPKKRFEELLAADSIGEFFHQNIRLEFAYRRL